jgi:hypothetical protein
MTLDDWYNWARLDVDRRSLPEMKPVLDALRTAAQRLRDASWDDDARGSTGTAGNDARAK